MTIAISLSGGGSKGDFEVGALHFLYDRGIRPQIVCSTSVGSVNGLKLCEGEGGAGQGLAGLTAIWLSLDTYSDFFAEQPWLLEDLGPIRYVRRYLTDFAALNPHSWEQQFAVNDSLRALIPAELDAVAARLNATGALNELYQVTSEALGTFTANLMPFPFGIASMINLGIHVADLAAKLESLADTIPQQSAFFNLNPTRAKATASLDLSLVNAWAAQGNKLRMAAVGLRSGDLHYVTEKGDVLNRDGVAFTSGVSTPPECAADESEIAQINERIADLNDILPRTPMVAKKLRALNLQLNAAQARLDSCLVAHPPRPAPLRVGLIDAMIASSTIPTFFPPVPMGNDLYVDGGVREVIPVEAAFQCGADTVYAISASRAKIAPDGADVRYNFATVALRSLMEIAINEAAYSDIHFLQKLGHNDIKAIYPRFDIHTTFTLYPSFVRNRMAYGYMCAGDVVSPPPNERAANRARQIADLIAIRRYGVARLECWARGKPVPPTLALVPFSSPAQRDAVLVAISEMKAEIGALVAERRSLGAVMPPEDTEWGNANLWSTRQEVHPWNRGGALRDDATLANDSIPASVLRGGTLRIRISAFNSGTTTWTSAEPYELQVDPRFNVMPKPLTGSVVPGGTCVFDFTLPAPAASIDGFVCQMARAGIAFGEASIPVRIVVTQPAEPARCRTIRSQITSLRAKIAVLEDSIPGDPQESARIRASILALRQQVTALTAEGSQLACSL